jgi:hypothetical protein
LAIGLIRWSSKWEKARLVLSIEQEKFLHHAISLGLNPNVTELARDVFINMTLFFDPNDPNLRAKIDALHPTPGYCILVDMVGSTAMKDAPLLEWAPRIYNAFANTMAFLDPSIRPLKTIGDEIMFYISCEQMDQLGEGPLLLYSGLFSVAGDQDPIFTDVKIAIAYCEKAYRPEFRLKNTH